MENALVSLQRLVALAARRADLVLAVVLMAVVFMLVLPLPTVLVDVLVAINIAVSALLLMVAMYLPSPLSFTSFPSVLLVTTLFRLALSIATTRLILLQADAGHIIEAFGNFVVGGNLIVGLVVFLILTIVQFIVITKGAERVAEVAARFSLDAMPGKQMSIDADMRAGAIDMNEARRRRTRLEKESQLYGAMDGAVKFVKGDAIASIIIVFVNLGGGMLIGTMQRGLPAGEAMAIYSVLTIGDGLIAQIPALLMSITAGMIVTRVTSEDGGRSNVGRDIAEQVLAQPNALLVAGAIMLGFALIPGMPGWVFMVLAVVAGVVGFVLLGRGLKGATASDKRTAGPTARAGTAEEAGAGGEGDGKAAASYAPTMPLVLDLSHELEGTLNARALIAALQEVREETYMQLGVPLPALHLRYNKGLATHGYQILVQEISSARGVVRPGHLLVRESKDNLKALEIPFDEAPDFLPGIETLWTPEGEIDRLREYGIHAMDMMQVLAHHLRVDGMLACGEGQRLGIFAAAGCGKSTLMGMLAKGAEVDVTVIALIGERGHGVPENLHRHAAGAQCAGQREEHLLGAQPHRGLEIFDQGGGDHGHRVEAGARPPRYPHVAGRIRHPAGNDGLWFPDQIAAVVNRVRLHRHRGI